MAVVYRYVGILTVDVVVFFRSPSVFHSQDSFPSTFRPRLCLTVKEQPRKKTQAGKLTRPGIESGPPKWEATMLPLEHNGGQQQHLRRTKDDWRRCQMALEGTLWLAKHYTWKLFSGGHRSRPYTTRNISRVLPRIEPGTSVMVVRRDKHYTTEIVSK